MVAEGVVFRPGGHARWFEPGKGKGTGVVLVDVCVNVGRVGGLEAKSSGDFFEDVNDGKEVFAGRTESNVFGLHGGE